MDPGGLAYCETTQEGIIQTTRVENGELRTVIQNITHDAHAQFLLRLEPELTDIEESLEADRERPRRRGPRSPGGGGDGDRVSFRPRSSGD